MSTITIFMLWVGAVIFWILAVKLFPNAFDFGDKIDKDDD